MRTPGDIPELPEDDAVLREIAAMDLALARRLYGEAMAEPDADKAADITRAYNRVTRSLRQSIALRARLAQGWENHHVNHGRRVDLTAESPTMAFRTRVQPAPAHPALAMSAQVSTRPRDSATAPAIVFSLKTQFGFVGRHGTWLCRIA